MTTQGNWQAATTKPVTAEPTNDLFDIKKNNPNLPKPPVINTVKSGTPEDPKQPLSVLTKDVDGTLLDPPFTVGECKISKISERFGTLQDCSIDSSGNMIFRSLVTASATKNPNLCPGMQNSAMKGAGRNSRDRVWDQARSCSRSSKTCYFE